MRYMLKENTASLIKKKYRNSYIMETVGLCSSYVSQIINRKRAVPKNVAYVITKAINNDYEIEDLFERVK